MAFKKASGLMAFDCWPLSGAGSDHEQKSGDKNFHGR